MTTKEQPFPPAENNSGNKGLITDEKDCPF